MEISEKQFTLVMIAIDLALKWALRQSDEDIDVLIEKEEKRNEALMAELETGVETS